MLWMYKRIIFGKIINENVRKMPDLKRSELLILICLAFPVVFFGLYPEPIINTMEVSIENLLEIYNSNTVFNQTKIYND